MSDMPQTSGGQRPLSSSELAAFCLQISIILKSGIPLHDGVSMLYEDIGDSRVRHSIKIVSDALAGNKPLYEALTKSGVFPSYLINMVRIGSESGRLEDVTAALADYYEREDSLHQSIRSAVVYPMALIMMMFIVMMVLAVKVLPVFEQVFNGLGTTMSPTAVAIMGFGLAVSRYSLILLVLAGLILGFMLYLFKTENGGRLLAKITSKGKFSEELSISRFTSSMALMLSSGLDTERAFHMASDVITNKNVRNKVDDCIKLIEGNSSFIDALFAVKLFPAMTTRMLSLGFRAGSLDTVMKKIANDYAELLESALIRRVSMIEPVSVAILSVIIGIILISVMLPLMSVMASIG